MGVAKVLKLAAPLTAEGVGALIAEYGPGPDINYVEKFVAGAALGNMVVRGGNLIDKQTPGRLIRFGTEALAFAGGYATGEGGILSGDRWKSGLVAAAGALAGMELQDQAEGLARTTVQVATAPAQQPR